MTGAKRKNSRQPPWEGPDSEGISFGAWLRQQREVRQIGLREVAESSKISLRHLQAFEQDRFDLLPAPVFAKGFLRQYSEYVGLDADEVVNHYLWARQAVEPDEEPEEEPQHGNPRLKLFAALVFVALLAWLLILGIKRFGADPEAPPGANEEPAQEAPGPPAQPPQGFVPPPPMEVTPSAAATPEEPAPEPAGPPVPLRVNLEFTRDCWVEAIVDRGRQRITQTFLPGEPLQIDAQSSVLFRKLGNAGGVKIEVNGRELPLEGGDGQVVTGLLIDLETAARLRQEEL